MTFRLPSSTAQTVTAGGSTAYTILQGGRIVSRKPAFPVRSNSGTDRPRPGNVAREAARSSMASITFSAACGPSRPMKSAMASTSSLAPGAQRT